MFLFSVTFVFLEGAYGISVHESFDAHSTHIKLYFLYFKIIVVLVFRFYVYIFK
jgi:hypothetical protein